MRTIPFLDPGRRAGCRALLWGLVALLWLPAPGLLAADGLDDNPGAAGFVPFDLDSNRYDQAFACAAQPDGKVILAGYASDDDGEVFKIALARLTPNGLLDTTFGNAGRVVIDMTALGYSVHTSSARAVFVDSQGRLLVVGSMQVAPSGAILTFVARLLADGTIDQTFLYNGISGGWYFSSFLQGVRAAGIDPAGNLWIVGPELTDQTGGWSFLRLDPNGAELAARTIPVDSHPVSSPTALVFQSDGKPILGGWGQEATPPYHASFLAIRLLAGGPGAVPDPTFGFTNDGWVRLEYPQSAQLQSMALLPSRELVVAGQAGPIGAEDIVIQRLTENGIGNSFEEYVAFDGSGGDGTYGQVKIVAQADGMIVLAARVLTGNAGNYSDTGVARLTPNLQLDTSFGGMGTGKRTFGLASPPPGNGDEGIGCLILVAGKPFVGGWAEYSGSDYDFAFRRLTRDFIFADGFESGAGFASSTAVWGP